MCTIEPSCLPACLPDVSQMYVIRYARRAELPAEERERERAAKATTAMMENEGDRQTDGQTDRHASSTPPHVVIPNHNRLARVQESKKDRSKSEPGSPKRKAEETNDHQLTRWLHRQQFLPLATLARQAAKALSPSFPHFQRAE